MSKTTNHLRARAIDFPPKKLASVQTKASSGGAHAPRSRSPKSPSQRLQCVVLESAGSSGCHEAALLFADDVYKHLMESGFPDGESAASFAELVLALVKKANGQIRFELRSFTDAERTFREGAWQGDEGTVVRAWLRLNSAIEKCEPPMKKGTMRQ